MYRLQQLHKLAGENTAKAKYTEQLLLVLHKGLATARPEMVQVGIFWYKYIAVSDPSYEFLSCGVLLDFSHSPGSSNPKRAQ